MISLEATRNRDRVLIVEAGKMNNAVTATRATIGTNLNASGVLVSAAINVPRYDYSTLGVYLGLLIEESKTNRALRSRDMTNATWVKSNITTVQTATGLDGVTNAATQLTATAANGTSLQTITDATSRLRAISFDIKRVSGTGNIQITGDNGTTWTTVTSLSSSLFARYFVAVTNANPVIGVRIVTSGDVIVVDYAQCEDGGMTSRIATTTATVTRAADIIAVNTLSSINFNSAEGTFVCIVRQGVYAASQQTYFSLNDGTTGNRIQVRRETVSNVNVALTITGGVTQTSIIQTVGSDGSRVKMAMGYKLNDFSGSCNGLVVSTDTAATLPTVNRLHIGVFVGGNVLNGHIEYLAYYPGRRRANSELQGLSQ